MGKKIELDDLKVQSFVTSLDKDEQDFLKGGTGVSQLAGAHCIPGGGSGDGNCTVNNTVDPAECCQHE